MSPLRAALVLLLLAALAALLHERRAVESGRPDHAATADAPAISDSRSHPRPDRPAATAGSALIAALTDDTAPVQPAPQPARAAIEPLPPWDAKLVDVLPALQARAAAGDVAAACHLGLALSACAAFSELRLSAAALRNIDPRDDDALGMAAWRELDYIRPGREQTCIGLDASHFTLRFDLLLQAAEGGSNAAALAFVDGLAFVTAENWIRHPDRLEIYRERTPRLVRQLLERGDLRMAVLLAMLADGMNTSLLAQALALDDRSRATFQQLGWMLRDKPAPQTGIAVAEADWAAGRLQAERLRDRYFAGRRVDAESLNFRDRLSVEACTQ